MLSENYNGVIESGDGIMVESPLMVNSRQIISHNAQAENELPIQLVFSKQFLTNFMTFLVELLCREKISCQCGNIGDQKYIV